MRERSTNIPRYCTVVCTVGCFYCKNNVFDRLAALVFSSNSSANGVKTVLQGHNFKVLLSKEFTINAMLPSLSLFLSVYWCRDYS